MKPRTQVVVLDSLEYCANVKNLEGLAQNLTFKLVNGNIRSADLVRHILVTEDIDTIMHFAAETHVDNSFGNSFTFTETNVLGTHVLLEACRLSNTVRRFVHVSTDEVYGEASFHGSSSSESDSMLAPTNPYSASKAAAEMLVIAYGTSYNLQYVITRGNNVYGPRQFPEKAIPKFIHLLHRGQKIPIHGSGLALRSYMHVSDAATAFDFILHKGKNQGIYNIGAREERTIMSVARVRVDTCFPNFLLTCIVKDLCKIFKKDETEQLEHVTDRAFNDRRYFVDSSKLEKLGWKQEKDWAIGLVRFINVCSTSD